MGKGKVSKNNVTGLTKKRYLGEDIVVPTLYDGNAVKKGSYMTGMVNGKLVMDDKEDRPMPLKNIGQVR
tara:strand:- start:148 stop:354 length:207 start_codon:yes stop_codon:yes gene_type:complete